MKETFPTDTDKTYFEHYAKYLSREKALRHSPAFRRDCDEAARSYLEHNARGKDYASFFSNYHTLQKSLSNFLCSHESRDLADNWGLAQPWHYLSQNSPMFKDFYPLKVISPGSPLLVKIDTTKSLKLIQAAIAEVYRLYATPKPKGLKYQAPDVRKMWLAYELVSPEGLNDKRRRKAILEATWEMFPKTKGVYPSNADRRTQEADRCFHQVMRWVEKAEKEISDISHLRK